MAESSHMASSPQVCVEPATTSTLPPRVSLIVTVYNRERYLEETLQSILAQSETNFELLVWDDGSTDSSARIAQCYVERDSRIRFFQAKNQGVAKALNAAIAQTTAPYIGWVDSDDLLAPNSLAVTAAALDRYASVGMVYTNYEEIDASGSVIGQGSRCNIPYSKQRLLVDFMTFHFRLLRRSVLEQVGLLDLSYDHAEDYDLCLRLSEVTDIYHIPQTLYLYRVHRSSLSQQNFQQQVNDSRRAIQAALRRRGLAERYEVRVKPVSQFYLVKRSTVDAISSQSDSEPEQSSQPTSIK